MGHGVAGRGLTAALLVLATALAMALAVATAAVAACRPDAADLRWPGGSARFAVEVADDPAERTRGLMFRESLPQAAGMLFLFPRPGRVSFWMRNTLIPLDLIFFDAAGRVVHVHPEAIPHDETPITGGDAVLAVLEINGGLAARLGIAAGAELRHPGMPQDRAAWPC
jgi:uncharacterized membrane protein (UPF0127 family)